MMNYMLFCEVFHQFYKLSAILSEDDSKRKIFRSIT